MSPKAKKVTMKSLEESNSRMKNKLIRLKAKEDARKELLKEGYRPPT